MNISEYPLGIQSFEKLRSNGYIYVDKTGQIFNLVFGTKYYFLSRPRRFGKSLLVSTLEEFFLGRRGLFKGLAIDTLLPDKWEKHAVLHLDLSGNSYGKTGDIDKALSWLVEKYERKFGLEKTDEPVPIRFERLINSAYEQSGRGVVILIDEYDAPIVSCFDNPEVLEYNRTNLHDFYAVMKKMDSKLRFVLLTGVGKLGKISAFSGLNNLRDITMDPEYATICGLTGEELHGYFDSGIRELATEHGWSADEAYLKLKKMYDGYHFARNLKDIYNPFSIIYCLVEKRLGDYWFASGTPSHLLYVLQQSRADLSRLNGAEISVSSLNSADVIQYDPVPFMFYTGYLTIKSYEQEEFGDDTVTLGYPNLEVSRGFLYQLLPMVTAVTESEAGSYIRELTRRLRTGDIDGFMETMRIFYAGIPYELSVRNEYYYQNVMYCIARLLGFSVQAEYRTSCGRIDLVVANAETIYVIEFKFDGSAEEALAQIESKEYALPFALDGRRVVKIGANFSPSTRTLDKWIIA